MLYWQAVTIRYRYITVDDELNPTDKFVEKTVRAGVMESFSDNYYNERGRTQQGSLNLVVNAYLANPVRVDEKTTATVYQVVAGGVTFDVERVLNYRYDHKKKVFDCKQTNG